MKITDIVFHEMSIPSTPFERRQGLPKQSAEKNAFLLRLVTDAGLEGCCVWDRNGSVMKEISKKFIKPILIGQDPRRIEYLWHQIQNANRSSYFPKYAAGVVDIALWDLFGKITDMPVYMLAGGYRNSIAAYASLHSYQDLGRYRDIVDGALKKGYKAIKLHGPGTPENDITLCRNVRNWVGKDFPLMFDAVGAYTYEEALRVGKELETLDYFWYEEPVKDSYAFQLHNLQEKLTIPILVAESSDESVYDAANQILLRTGSMIHGDPFIKAGITGILKIARVCEAFGITLQIHHSEIYGLHAACAVKNTLYYEQIVPEDTFRFDITKNHVEIDSDGCMRLNDMPGFGIEIDFDKIKKYEI